ncbi:MAG: hypothetical protein WBQ48_05665, partial [Aeromicrobium sp.]
GQLRDIVSTFAPEAAKAVEAVEPTKRPKAVESTPAETKPVEAAKSAEPKPTQVPADAASSES